LATLVLLLGATFYLFVIMGFFGDMPSARELQNKRNDTASEVYSADSVLLGRYFIYDRTNIAYRDIDTTVIEALVATEDARFYQHQGVDSRSLARVVVKSILLQKENSGGGSTLTQQLIKNLYPRRDYWILDMPINKAREMILARRLESVYTKPEILELYLNTVSFGGTIFGLERAAKHFFNIPAKKLKPEQAATLVGMLKATTSYNPRQNPAQPSAGPNGQVRLPYARTSGFFEKTGFGDQKRKSRQAARRAKPRALLPRATARGAGRMVRQPVQAQRRRLQPLHRRPENIHHAGLQNPA
jgi:penicillin-binding protein 1A